MQPTNDDTPRNVNVPTRPSTPSVRTPDREAAAKLMRQQIDTIYNDAPASGPHNVYAKTHSETTDHDAASSQNLQSHDWKQYHSAWQSYYQQYYERYYMAQLQRRQQAIAPTAHRTPQEAEAASSPKAITENEAVDELRNKILSDVKERSEKVRRSRHFMPLMAALTVAIVFSILQYNQLIVGQVKAYVSPGSINPQNIVLDPMASTKVGPDPKIIIPKINVEAPMIYDIPSLEENVIQTKLRDGVVHYPFPGASSVPGQKGNTVVLGHSSNDVFDKGNYKFIFVQLDKLVKGDVFYLNYQGTRYTYSVTETRVIAPTEVGQLVMGDDKPLATLVTCTPPGTALKRLLVIGEQISPDPTKATVGTQTKLPPVKPSNIAGNAPTLFERLFGLN